jgi:hypothetical protein
MAFITTRKVSKSGPVRYDVVRGDPGTELETVWHLYNREHAETFANELRDKYPWCEIEVRAGWYPARRGNT